MPEDLTPAQEGKKRAEDLGHDLEWDPPMSLTGSTARWTCVNCGEAVLVHGSTIYGNAADARCQGRYAP